MLREGTGQLLNTYCEKNEAVKACRELLQECIARLCECFAQGGQLLICGNGGSCADADHIVGELVKAFKINRPLTAPLARALQEQSPDGALLAKKLQGGVPAINLAAHTSLVTAMINDVGGDYIFAQQVAAYGRPRDVLIGISTSGNSPDVLNAGRTAKAKGMCTIGLTGRTGGQMKDLFDAVICVPADSTEDIQDLHSKIYHTLCACMEYEFWG